LQAGGTFSSGAAGTQFYACGIIQNCGEPNRFVSCKIFIAVLLSKHVAAHLQRRNASLKFLIHRDWNKEVV